ncbi:MAG: chemotaxis methyl-accepting protein methylase, partial [Psychrobacter glaciei]
MIFATDIDKDAIEIARKASYLNKITDDVPKD